MKNDLVTKADLRDFEIRFEAKLEEKLEEKLESKLDSKLDKKLDEKLAGLRIQVEQNSIDIFDLKTDMNQRFASVDNKFDTVIIALDGIAGLISDNRVEKVAAESTFRRHEAKLDEHESRIGGLEIKMEGIVRGGVS
jgi:hypothetical protein